MADDLFGYDDEDDEPKGRDNLFLWTVFILLLIGAAFACWLGSFYIFGHPENPRAYKLLLKLKKIEAPQRFEVTAAPPGEFFSPQKLFDKYGKLTRLELEEENAQLLRNYIKNFRETKRLVPYVTGRFVILNSYELKPADMFATGVVALAQAAEFPQVMIEHVYTAPQRNVAALRTMLQTGLDMKIERTNDLSAIVHVEKIPDGRLRFTVVPLLYGTYALKQGTGTFSLEPPGILNLKPGLPVLKSELLQESLKSFVEYRRKNPSTLPSVANPETTPPPSPELVRVDTVAPGDPVPLTGAMPSVAVATPAPLHPPIAAPTPRLASALPRATPSLAVAMLATPVPRAATPVPVPSAPPRLSPTGVPLQPFIEARRDPSISNDGATWRTYPAGQAPPARSVSLDEVGALADRGEIGERIYLRGDFRVTASGSTSAVLRDANKPDAESPRIVVKYPVGFVPPAERERFARDASRPFEIYDVRRAEGVVTIWVREIVKQ